MRRRTQRTVFGTLPTGWLSAIALVGTCALALGVGSCTADSTISSIETPRDTVKAFVPGPPTATTQAATNITDAGLRLNGAVNPNGGLTSAYFEWGVNSLLASPASSPATNLGDGKDQVALDADLTGLTCGTTYYFRTVAQPTTGALVRGDILPAATAYCSAPDLQPSDYSITPHSVAAGAPVSVSWTIRNSGGSASNASTVVVRLNQSSSNSSGPDLQSFDVPTLPPAGAFAGSATIAAPAAGGTYYVWVVADNTGSAGQTSAATANDAAMAGSVTVAGPATTYTIATAANPADGGSTIGGGVVAANSNVIVTASPSGAYHFVSWTDGGGVVATTASYPFTATTNRSLVANFTNLHLVLPSVPIGYVGLPYSATFTATGGNGTYSYSLTPSIPGLTLNASTGVLSGTPTTKGSYSYTIQVTSGGNTDQNTAGVLISGVGIATNSLPPATEGVSYATTLSAIGGNGTNTWSIEFGGDPVTGLTLEPNTGVLHGIPVTSGIYSINFGLRSGTDVATKFLTLTVANGAPVAIATPSPLPNATQGAVYSTSITAMGGSGEYTWTVTAGGAPPGMTLSVGKTPSLVVSGTPTTPGTYTFTANVSSSDGTSASKPFNLTVVPTATAYVISTSANPSIGGAASGGGTVAANASVTVTATPAASYTFVNWTESGTPVSNSASYTFTATSSRTLVANFVTGGVVITTSSSPSSGGTTIGGGTYTLGSTVTLTGSPTGDYHFMNWTESGAVVSTAASFSFAAATNRSLVANFTTLNLVSPFLPTGYVGIPYSSTFSATGGNGTYTFALTPSIPGLTLNPSTGVLSGTPTTKGSYSYTIKVTSGGDAYQTITSIFISGIGITTTSLPAATAGVSYSTTLSAIGGNGTNTWSIEFGGDMVTGLTLEPNTGVLHGIPATSGTSSINFGVSSGSDFATKFLTLVVAKGAPVAIATSSPLPNATQGAAYAASITATDGSGDYTWTVTDGGAPPGMTLIGGKTPSLVVSGTPTTPGTYTFTAKVSTSDGTSASKPFSLTVVASTPTYVISTSANPSIGGTANGGGTFAANASVTVTATPAAGYTFGSWTESGTPVSSSATYSFTATSSRTLVANFLAGSVVITTSSNPIAGGTTIGGGTVALNSNVIVTASPTGAYHFVSWTEGGTVVATTASYPFTATTSRSLVANFTNLHLVLPIVPIGYVGLPYSATFTATGGNGTYSYSLKPIIPGLTLNASTGVLSGTPTTKGSYSYTIQVTSGGDTDQNTTGVLISGVGIATTSLPPATQNVAYSTTLSAIGGNGTNAWSMDVLGDLVGGLTLESNTGVLHGIPVSSGTYSIDFVLHSGSDAAQKFITLTVAPGPVTISASSPLSNATEGSPYNASIGASGGTGAYVWELVSGTVPPGLAFARASSPTAYFLLSGTPTTPGTYTFTVKVTASGDSSSSTKSLTVTVNPKP